MRIRILLAIAVLTLGVNVASAPSVSAAPTSAKSYYVQGYDLNWAYQQGCALGTEDANTSGTQTHVVVLDFGGLYQSGSTWKFTVWAGTDITLASAGSMVYQFGRGYWSCTIGDSTSTVYIGIGTKNDIGSITYSAGNALSQQARATWNSLQASGYTQAYAIGANDFEDWGRTGSAATALNSNSRAWMDGYNAYTSKVFFVNYGSASGCPTSSVPSANSCNPGLTADTIWYVSWSGVAYPLPEIYATSGANASQWKNLSIYSVNKGSGKFFFKGVMTQYGACSQRGGCSGTNNTPTAGWNQLNTSVNSDSRTVTTPGPPTDIYWS